MTQMFAQLIHNDGYLGMKDYIGKVFPVVGRSPRGHYLLQLKEGYSLNFSKEAILLLQAVEELKDLEWKVGTKVLVKRSSINNPHFDSRVSYVGTIEVVEGERFKVKFPEASFAATVVEPDNYSSWWFKSELELVPNDYDGGKEPMTLKMNDKCYIAGDGKHLTKDISKANMTEDYCKHLSDKLTASFKEIYAADRLF